MRLDGIPNDTMQAWNPLACILLGPVVQHGLFPLLRRLRIPFGPVVRISVACTIMGAAMAYAAILQHVIYSRGPCFDRPGACAAASSADGTIQAGNDLSVWKQLPVWFVLAVGEILGFATISEIAYEQAPASMKSLVQAVTQLTAGLAAVLGIALSPVMRDPLLVVLYSVIAGLTVAAALPFWLFFRAADRRGRS
jgi:POT family proton-dependent oligopeptide transporter